MYVPVKGGAEAIAASRAAVDKARRGDLGLDEIAIEQIIEQMALAVDRVMTEGGLYDRRLAAIALKQSQGDMAEAVFLLRAHRAQLVDFGAAEMLDLNHLKRTRHISATQKELVGGQILGATYDYTHRLLDFSLANSSQPNAESSESVSESPAVAVDKNSTQTTHYEDLIRREAPQEPVDITRKVTALEVGSSERLATLVRGEEGYLTGLAYESLRRASSTHPYVAELSAGAIEVMVAVEELGLTVSVGEIDLTACTTLMPDFGQEAQLLEGFGIAFGANERKAVAMGVVDLAVKSDQNLSADVLMHVDGVASSGYVSHLKLPHYSDFDADIARLRRVHAQKKL
ncbi:Bacterial phosphonate metabolism protein (PhnI) [Oligella ureolytica]|uniref:Bacterial phosphonate metabolism protein (PhnI) n=1 Tax=Oligella ureolytica TaxID=90244 RepID=A0A378XIF4_9BURK|nr:carbon-phosphorus lyase complex subunit PhnI [Oligella ureolytica]QPT39689.1 carbon-phosphorus lyase complex subunit PhnI [Oligella ureolytica]SUA52426.1 Bacterial phosphonate metabolism protein (PhnI) [Oligella ureolytica]SUA57200.1 Bacterial phosphonate metabolism protein (PhnI) [Oligella ureolytica]